MVGSTNIVVAVGLFTASNVGVAVVAMVLPARADWKLVTAYKTANMDMANNRIRFITYLLGLFAADSRVVTFFQALVGVVGGISFIKLLLRL